MIDRETYNQEWVKDKRVNHIRNVAEFTGFYHGAFFIRGRRQEAKRPLKTVLGRARRQAITAKTAHLTF